MIYIRRIACLQNKQKKENGKSRKYFFHNQYSIHQFLCQTHSVPNFASSLRCSISSNQIQAQEMTTNLYG